MGSLFSLTNNTILPSVETKILKAEEVEIMLQAEEILGAAQKRAQDILEQARQEVQKQKKQAYEEGLEEGRLEHTEKIMETVLSSVEFIEGIESQLVHVVNMSIRKILGELDQKDLIVLFLCLLVKGGANILADLQKHYALLSQSGTERERRE